MPLYRCSICGENFPGIILGLSSPIGFYTTRYVDAANPAEAEALALNLLRDEALFNLPPESRSQDAKIFFEEIVEAAPDTQQMPQCGFSFFTMGT